MIELVRTDDPVLVTWLQSRFAEAGIAACVFDAHTASAYGGALGLVGRRIMVAESDIVRARMILVEAREIGAGCRADDQNGG